MDVENELAKILQKELQEEFDRQTIDIMIGVMFPNKDVFISFTKKMGYDRELLPDEEKIGKITLYTLMDVMYNTYRSYHTSDENQGKTA